MSRSYWKERIWKSGRLKKSEYISIHSFPKTVLGAWGSRLKFVTHRRKLLVTAPIVATNGIEDRHKE
jgi:hypothetical protein